MFDSPFSSLTKLICELGSQKIGLPQFLFQPGIPYVSQKVFAKTGVHLGELEISSFAKRIQGCPGLFVTSKQDKLVNYLHTEELFNAYGGPKQLHFIDCEHHEARQQELTNKILDFF